MIVVVFLCEWQQEEVCNDWLYKSYPLFYWCIGNSREWQNNEFLLSQTTSIQTKSPPLTENKFLDDVITIHQILHCVCTQWTIDADSLCGLDFTTLTATPSVLGHMFGINHWDRLIIFLQTPCSLAYNDILYII